MASGGGAGRGRGVVTRRVSAGRGSSPAARGQRTPATSIAQSPCVTCCFPVKDDEESGIACDECNEWCHGSQTCTGLPSDFVKEILKHQGKGEKYVCTRCRLSPPANSSSPANPDLQSLRDCLTQMFNTIAGLSNTVKSIDLRISDTPRDSVVSGGVGGTDRSDVRTIIREEVRELNEREKRKDSIIIRGLPFGEDYQAKFNPIASYLLPERSDPVTLVDVVSISPSLVGAKIPNSNLKQELLSRSNKLYKSQYAQVFISRDLTFNQREDLKRKRAARRTDVSSLPRQATQLASGLASAPVSSEPDPLVRPGAVCLTKK